jgi:hypothetical protein
MAKLKTTRPTFTADAIPSDINDAVFLGNPVLDSLVSSMIAMGSELWETKRRLKVMQAVMDKNGITKDMIEQYMPTDEENAEWEADRDRFIDLTFGPLANPGTTSWTTDFPHGGKGS